MPVAQQAIDWYLYPLLREKGLAGKEIKDCVYVPEAVGEDGGGAGIGEGSESWWATGTRYRLGRICLEQTGHQEVSR